MFKSKSKTKSIAKASILVLMFLLFHSCNGQMSQKSTDIQPFTNKQITVFPQIHTNLNGMVSEFVRTMYQDKKGNFWFGTNGNGIIRYNAHTLETITAEECHPWLSVREIVEDRGGNIWFGTSNGLIKYDGEKITKFSEKDGLPDDDIWGLALDKNEMMWIGTIAGVCRFDGRKFISFALPSSIVDHPRYMLSDKLVLKIMEDHSGNIWLVTDGNGIFKYTQEGQFTHLTNKNGLTDNNAADILEDKKGNIWIGTFYGGTSMYDGKNYTHFTKNGIIDGIETYNFWEDRQGNIWFSAENYGVYKYDWTEFSRYTKDDGLATNVIQSIYEDSKGQLWFGTWQGISLYDGQKFMNAADKEHWLK
jgi:ligand-binding sensor domain-containing protein